MDIVNRIIELQNKQGLSTNALAQRAGLSQSTVQSTIKRGIVPTIGTLEKLCSALGITLAEFFSEEPEQNIDPQERQLVSAYRKLNGPHKLTLASTAEALLIAEEGLREADHQVPEEE